jgi:hypothetical protein
MLGLSLPRAWKSVFFMPACGAGVPLYCVLFERAFQTDGYVAAISPRRAGETSADPLIRTEYKKQPQGAPKT